jgi:hypothetical protein
VGSDDPGEEENETDSIGSAGLSDIDLTRQLFDSELDVLSESVENPDVLKGWRIYVKNHGRTLQ